MSNLHLYLDPSKEIHLARNPAGANEQQLFLTFRNNLSRRQVLGWDYELESVPLLSTAVVINQGSAGSVLVEYDPVTSMLRILPTSSGTGVNDIQLRVADPRSPVTQLTLDVKVHIHETLDEWWFGMDSMTIPRDDLTDTNTVPATLWMHHAQVPVYAHFDRNPSQPNQIVTIADITGHSYISITSNNTAIACLLYTSDAADE